MLENSFAARFCMRNSASVHICTDTLSSRGSSTSTVTVPPVHPNFRSFVLLSQSARFFTVLYGTVFTSRWKIACIWVSKLWLRMLLGTTSPLPSFLFPFSLSPSLLSLPSASFCSVVFLCLFVFLSVMFCFVHEQGFVLSVLVLCFVVTEQTRMRVCS